MVIVPLAMAASPGGFRVGAGVPTHVAGARVVVAPELAGPVIAQATVGGQVALGKFRVAADLPVAAVWSEAFDDVGIGNARLAGAFVWGRTHWQGLGAELLFPAGPPDARVDAWGSLGRETLPTVAFCVTYEAAFFPEAPFHLRVAAGWQVQRYRLWYPYYADLALAHVRPIVGPLSAVGEVELAADPVPLSARLLARLDAGGVSVDVGAQQTTRARVPHAIAQVRGFF
ncbi:MAG: hypothetical protein ACOZNI_13555 [Myxococcota bacterium]